MSVPTMRLGDCCEIVSGATPKTGVAEYWDGEICWATPKDLSDLQGKHIGDTPRKITDVGLSSCAAAVLPVGSVLLSSRAPIGHVAINTRPMATNQGFKSLVPDPGRVDANYLYYWLRSHRSQLEYMGNGATFKELSKAVVAEIKVPFPAIHEQQRVARVLDEADALRAKRRAAIALLDDLAQAIFFDMFGDPGARTGRWPVSDIASISTQVTDGEHLTPKRTSSGIKLLSARNVQDGFIDFEKVDYVGPSEYARISRRCDPRPGDVLVSCSGTIGRVAIVETEEPLSLVRSVALIKPDHSLVTSQYLAALMRTPALKARMQQSAKASSQANLFQGPIRKLPVPLPPLELQQDFGVRLQSVSRSKERQFAGLAGLDDLFGSLQQRAFRGELWKDRGI
ncbi:restriction endonuclease subunit S [Actinomadura sp. KC216]|uniref:restriction endonuclease subunit S n=1 Tax=Actinomadura sp. KC216 TaxID=2530370 RepID=UPI00104402D0|nr:restriction endonuclease subunit S [Actinomadura sp. KC216]TDB85138.1 restriction endonuclease subunit S [Actinomadura sp. KC216]